MALFIVFNYHLLQSYNALSHDWVIPNLQLPDKCLQYDCYLRAVTPFLADPSAALTQALDSLTPYTLVRTSHLFDNFFDGVLLLKYLYLFELNLDRVSDLDMNLLINL